MKSGIPFEPHLALSEIILPCGGEWSPRLRRWLLFQTAGGISYWQQPDGACEIAAGASLVLPEGCRGTLRASQLGGVVVNWFRVDPEKLTGLLSFGEQRALEQIAARARISLRLLPPADPVSERFRSLARMPGPSSPSARLQLLQLFLEVLAPGLEPWTVEDPPELGGRGRLRQYLRDSAGAELLEVSLRDLAPKMNCSPRHLSRLFHEEVGVPFRQRQTELRLAKAREMLARTNAKVAEVAATSGYDSLSLFSFMFKKRFGLSPGKWRQRQRATSPKRSRVVRSSPLCA